MNADLTERWQQAAAAALQAAEADWPYTEKLSERWLALLFALADEWQKERAMWLNIFNDAWRKPQQLGQLLLLIAQNCRWWAVLSVPVEAQRSYHALVLKGLVLQLIWQWRGDTTPDLSKTMAALDRTLQHLEKWQNDFT